MKPYRLLDHWKREQLTNRGKLKKTLLTVLLGAGLINIMIMPESAAAAASGTYYFTWYDNLSAPNWIVFANPNTDFFAGAHYDLSIGGQVKSLPSEGNASGGGMIVAQYPGLNGGPVVADFDFPTYGSATSALVSQRTLWAGNSLEEVVGTPTSQLSSHFYWTWYDEQSPGYKNWVLVANPGSSQVFYRIRIDGITIASGSIPAGADVTPGFPGVIGGPVEVEAWADSVGGSIPANVIASQRVLSNNGGAFNEMPGIPEALLSDRYMWTWYDSKSAGAQNWVLVANPPGAVLNIYCQIRIGGALAVNTTGPIAPGDTAAIIIPNTIGGPVEVNTFSDPANPGVSPSTSICSQRTVWGPSFEEVPGLAASQSGGYSALSSRYHWTWYDNLSSGVTNWILIVNPSDHNPITAYIDIGGICCLQYHAFKNIGPGEHWTPNFPGAMQGPVTVSAVNWGTATPANVITSQRVLWNGYFNEVPGTASS